MTILAKFSDKLRLVLLFALVVGLLYLLYFVRAAQQVQDAADNAYLRYLPTIASTHTADLPVVDWQQQGGGVAANATETMAGVMVDTTEDYKALGYTDNRKIVRDDENNLYIAYRKKWQGQYRIFIAKSTNQGKRWQVLNGNKAIEAVGDYTQRVPSFAIGRNAEDDANFLHLVWYGNDQEHPGNERQIKYLRFTTAGKRSTDDCCELNINIAGYDRQRLWQEHPAIYVNGSNVYIVWEGRDSTTTKAKIKFVRSSDFGRTWSETIDIAPSERITFSRPTLAVAYRGEERQIYVVAYGESKKSARSTGRDPLIMAIVGKNGKPSLLVHAINATSQWRVMPMTSSTLSGAKQPLPKQRSYAIASLTRRWPMGLEPGWPPPRPLPRAMVLASSSPVLRLMAAIKCGSSGRKAATAIPSPAMIRRADRLFIGSRRPMGAGVRQRR